jgi:hypothetical protein
MVTTSSVGQAAPAVLVGDVEYDFVDQNGVGWVTSHGAITVTITLGDRPALAIAGRRDVRDGQLVKGQGSAQDLKVRRWEVVVEERFPLTALVRDPKTGTFTFELEARFDRLAGSCAPTTVPKVARAALYECTITGFRWQASPHLPELHHPIVLEANPPAKPTKRVKNVITGKSRPGFGSRTVSVAVPLPPPPPRRSSPPDTVE